jgi:O-antigen/teichoic acid export membrane protein
VGVLLLRVSLAFITFFLNIFLVRWLGTADYGAYAYSLAWLVVLGVPALLGLDQLLVRSVAAYRTRSAWGSLRTLVRQASFSGFLAAISVAVLAGIIAGFCIDPAEGRLLITFWIALLLLPLITLARVRQAVLQGLHHVVLAQLPESILLPLIFLTLVLCVGLLSGVALTAPIAMGLNVLATAVALGVGVLLLLPRLPRAPDRSPTVSQDWSWLRSSLPLMCFSAVNVLTAEVDLLILGALKGPQDVGIYSVAVRTAELVPFILQAINPALAPHIASLHTVGDALGLQRLLTMSARLTLAAAAPVALGLILCGAWLLRVVYGLELQQGQTALAILSIGQLVNVGMGSVGMLLTMTGHAGDALWCIGVSGVLNFLLSVWLIPSWGLQGAALAAAASLVLWNVLMALSAYRKLGILCGPLGRIHFGGQA